MNVMKRWMWLVILALGVASLVFGIVFMVKSSSMTLADMTKFSGIAFLIIGITVILVSVMILGFTKGFEKVGAGFAELMKGLTGGGEAPK